MAVGKAILLDQQFDLVVSDGRFYYAYLPSVIIDGDLDLTNQITLHWGPDFRAELLADRTENGSVRNKYPIGLALTLLPGFLIGHVIALLSNGTIPANGYTWPYQLACLALIELLAWKTLATTDRLMTERLRISAKATLVGLVILALGTPYAYYAAREPFMVHAVSAFWCTQVAAIAAPAARRAPAWLWPRLTFCLAIAVVCRITNLHLLPLVIYGLLQSRQLPTLRQILISLPFAAAALFPIGLQLATWRVLSGSWIYYSYVGEGFNWMEPALWQTLFSSRHGLFFWSPVLFLALAALLLRASDALVRLWLIGGLLLWYVNSAWHEWWFGDAFGARAFIELSALFGIGLGLLFDVLRNKPRICWTLMLSALVGNTILMILYITHRITRDGYLFQ